MKTIAEKTAHAADVAGKVEKINQSHPKAWDKYIANRQKQVKTQKRGKA
jgi:hypothetical protein